MGRSPSPKRKREKHRERSKRKKRSRSRSRSRKRSSDGRRRRHHSDSEEEYERSRATRSRSYDRDRRRSPAPSSSKADKGRISADNSTPEMDDQEMKRIMGFSGFSSTKGKKVDGNNVGDVHVILKRKYRQYMNRKGGFNRPLDFVA